MKQLRVKLVPLSLALVVWLVWTFGVALSEPVESNAPATPNADSESPRIIYDQRQTGKYNIHVSIKDVALIEMDQNGIEDVAYGDDDYYYDEGHLTVKPILLNPTTANNQVNHTSPIIETSTHFINEQTSMLNNPTMSTISTISSNHNYSPNLLADIAATHSTNYNNITTLISSTESGIAPTEIPKKPAQNVVILDSQSLTHNSPTSTHNPSMTTATIIPAKETKARSKDIPIQSLMKEAKHQSSNIPKLPLHPYLKVAETAQMDGVETDGQHNEEKGDSKIYKFKVRRAHKEIPARVKTPGSAVAYPHPFVRAMASRRCRAHQYRDASGDCRTKRSSSFLKKLFNMLVTLPFPNERIEDNRDDE